MGRPRLGHGLVEEQFHVGVRFPHVVKLGMLAVLSSENEKRTNAGELPNVTASSLVRSWVMDRLLTEFDRVLVDEPHVIERMKLDAEDVHEEIRALIGGEDDDAKPKALMMTSTPKLGAGTKVTKAKGRKS